MISEGLNLAMFGMGIVFVFLVLLIYVTKLMSLIAQKLEASAGSAPAPAAARSRVQRPVRASADSADTARLKAVLAEAVKQYRTNH